MMYNLKIYILYSQNIFENIFCRCCCSFIYELIRTEDGDNIRNDYNLENSYISIVTARRHDVKAEIERNTSSPF